MFVGSTYKLLNSDLIMHTEVGTNVYDMSLFYNFSSTAIARVRPGLLLDGIKSLVLAGWLAGWGWPF